MSEWRETVRAPGEETEGSIVQAQSKSKTFFKRFMQRRIAIVAAVLLLILLIITVVGPELAPYGPVAPDYDSLLSGPNLAHILGADEYGRDVLSRLIVGNRLTFGVSLSSVIVGATIGAFLGVLVGYYGGILETLMMHGPDMLFAFPDVLLVIAIVIMIGPGIIDVAIVVAVLMVPSFAHTMRSTTLSVKESSCIKVARSIGCKSGQILSMYIFPGTMQAMIVNFTIRAGTTILTAASLNFLGFGTNVIEPDWRAMLPFGCNCVSVASHLVHSPGLLIFPTVLAFNLLGDGLQDMLSPKTKQGSAYISIFYLHTTEFSKGFDRKEGYQGT